MENEYNRFINHPSTPPDTLTCVFHATGSPTDGWNNRKAYCCDIGPDVFAQRQTMLCCDEQTQAHPRRPRDGDGVRGDRKGMKGPKKALKWIEGLLGSGS